MRISELLPGGVYMKSTNYVKMLSFVLSFLLILNFSLGNLNIIAHAANDDFEPEVIIIDSDTVIDGSNISVFDKSNLEIRIGTGVTLTVSDEAFITVYGIVAEEGAQIINHGIINAENFKLLSQNQYISDGQTEVDLFESNNSNAEFSGNNQIGSLNMNNGGSCNFSDGESIISNLYANGEAKIIVSNNGELNLGSSSSAADNIFTLITVEGGKLELSDNFVASGNQIIQNGGEMIVNSSSLQADITVEGSSSEAMTEISGKLTGELTIKSNCFVCVYGQADTINVYDVIGMSIGDYAAVREINVYATGAVSSYDYLTIPKGATINNLSVGSSFNVKLALYNMIFTLEPSKSYEFTDDIKNKLIKSETDLGTLYTKEESFGKFIVSNPFPTDVYAQFDSEKLYPFVFPEEELTEKYLDTGLGVYGYSAEDKVYFIKVPANSDKEIKVSADPEFTEYGEVSVSNGSYDLVEFYIEDKVYFDSEYILFLPDNQKPDYTLSGTVLEKEEVPDDPAEDPTDDPDEPTDDPDEPAGNPDEPTDNPDEPTDNPDEPTNDPDEPADNPDEPTENPEDNPTSNPNEPKDDSPENNSGNNNEKAAKKQGKASVTVGDVYYGLKPSVTISSETNDVSKASVRYKSGNEYLDNVPEKVGQYTVEVVIPENDEYEEVKASSSFKIEFLPAPTEMCGISGKEGETGYFRSSVTITPPKGYKVSLSLDGVYKNYLIFNSDVNLDGIYLIDDFGRKTDMVRLNKKIIVDKTNPTISGINNRDTVYSDKLTVEIFDEHLCKVVINGKPQTIYSNNFTVELTGGDQGKNITYTIEAYDRSDRCISQTVELKESWRADNMIPSGKPVWVYKGEKYRLPHGTWKIEGDSCIYSGDIDVFVAQDKQISLTQ